VDVLKRDHNALASRYVNTGYTCHFSLHVGRSIRRFIVYPRPVEAGPCEFPVRAASRQGGTSDRSFREDAPL